MKVKIAILLPIRVHRANEDTYMWEITLETCYYFSKGIRLNVYKISILGFGLRIKIIT